MRSTLVDAICANLRALPDRFSPGAQNWPKWTAEVRRVLTRLGHENGFYVSGDLKSEADCGEMGFDLSWRDYGRPHSPGMVYQTSDVLRSVPLICESEWHSTPEVESDFEKLLQARSAIKLMVFTARNREEWELRKARLVYLIRSFDAAPDEESYILACYPTQPWGLLSAIVSSDGNVLSSD